MARRETLIPLLLLAGMTAPVVAVDVINQTVWREENERILSIYGDLRRESSLAQPAMLNPDEWTVLRADWTFQTIAWEPQAPTITYPGEAAPTERVPEERHELKLSLRQSLWCDWLSFEMILSGVREDRTEEAYHFSDPETNFLLTVWSDRYQAVTLSLGCYHPFGDPLDWYGSHGTMDEGSWTPKFGLRGSFGIGLATLHVRGSYARSISGMNEVENQPDGLPDELDHTYQEFDSAVSVTYRVHRRLRLAIEQGYEWRQWRPKGGSDVSVDKNQVVKAPALGSIEVILVPKTFYLTAGAGFDLANRTYLDDGDRLVVNAGVGFIF